MNMFDLGRMFWSRIRFYDGHPRWLDHREGDCRRWRVRRRRRFRAYLASLEVELKHDWTLGRRQTWRSRQHEASTIRNSSSTIFRNLEKIFLGHHFLLFCIFTFVLSYCFSFNGQTSLSSLQLLLQRQSSANISGSNNFIVSPFNFSRTLFSLFGELI